MTATVASLDQRVTVLESSIALLQETLAQAMQGAFQGPQGVPGPPGPPGRDGSQGLPGPLPNMNEWEARLTAVEARLNG